MHGGRHIETGYVNSCGLFHGSCRIVMGTCLDIMLHGKEESQARLIWTECLSLAYKLEHVFNRFDPESELSSVNRGDLELDYASPEMRESVLLSGSYRQKTGGLFDVNVSGMGMDFGGFAKGYYLLRLMDLLNNHGVENAFADFGHSSIMAMGRHPEGGLWKVALTDPFDGYVIDEISLDGMSMSISGNSPGYWGHIINPLTGQRNFSRSLVTVMSRNPLDAEVLSTAYAIADNHGKEELERNFPDASFAIH